MSEDSLRQSSWAALPRLPAELAVLPLFNTVVYPGTAVPLAVSRPESIRLIDEAQAERAPIALVAIKAEDQRPTPLQPDDLYRVGTVALVHKLLRLPDATLRVALQGLERVTIAQLLPADSSYRARVRSFPDAAGGDTTPPMQQIVELVGRMAALIPQFPADLLEEIQQEDDPQRFSFLVASCLQSHIAERQALLETPSAQRRLDLLSAQLARTVRLLELSRQMRDGREPG